MKAFAAGALTTALVAVLIALSWSHGTDRRLEALRDSAAASRSESLRQDSAHAREQAAFDAERAVMAATIDHLTRRARATGQAVITLADTLWREAPDTCIPGIARLRLGMALHLAADSVAAEATTAARTLDSLELARERGRTREVAAQRDTAQSRLDRALDLAKRPGWTIGPHAGYGLTLVDGQWQNGWQVGVSVQRPIRLRIPLL